MNNRIFSLGAMALALFVASAPALAEKGVKDGPHAAHMAKCATTCTACQTECEACAKHCLALVAGGKKEHALAARFCADCGECCKTCGTLCTRQSPLAHPMLECCTTCCDECAAECEKFPNDKHMAACAKTCRDCAKECRELGKLIK